MFTTINIQVETEEHELYERQMSKEAIRYQNDWKDLIWLVCFI